MDDTTRMFEEAASAGDAVRRFLTETRPLLAELSETIRQKQPTMVVTCARGSSDHAATFGRYLFETRLGLPAVSLAPSLASLFKVEMKLQGALFLAISQSGGSPDLIASAKMARRAGALVVGLINAEGSPLAEACDCVLPLHAGPEKSVAATKSYILSLVAQVALLAAWTDDPGLQAGLVDLPDRLTEAWGADWSAGEKALLTAQNLFVVSRGLGLGIAQEAALKFKETSGIHAESFSTAEVKHGPMALVKEGFPVLLFASPDLGDDHHDDLVKDFTARGATVLSAGRRRAGALYLPVPQVQTPILAYIVMIQRFYRMMNRIALDRGYNPDEPPFLKKVTETL